MCFFMLVSCVVFSLFFWNLFLSIHSISGTQICVIQTLISHGMVVQMVDSLLALTRFKFIHRYSKRGGFVPVGVEC